MNDNDIECPACKKVIGRREYDKILGRYKMEVRPGIIINEGLVSPSQAGATRIHCNCGHTISIIQGSTR